MDELTIPPLNHDDAERLRERAAQNARSVEDEARHILHTALQAEPSGAPEKLGTVIHQRFKSVGGVDLPDPARDAFPRDPFAQAS